MIKVEKYFTTGKFGNSPNETFIVKDENKIKFWKRLAEQTSFIKITELE